VYNSPYALQENKFGRGVELEGRELADFVNGLTTAVVDNNTLGVSNVREDNEKLATDKTTFKIGAVVGDFITAAQGILEMGGGGTEAVATTAGIVTAPLSALGAIAATHGAAVFAKSTANMVKAMVNTTKPTDSNPVDGNNKPTRNERMQTKKESKSSNKGSNSNSSRYGSEAQHNTNKSNSNKPKHEGGQIRKARDKGGEKGDGKRKRYQDSKK
jgi:hypothetical protein